MNDETVSHRVFWLALGAILLLSAAIRLWTVGHGLPELQVGDENSDLSTSLRLTRGELPARHVRYHRSLIAYTDAAAVGGLFAYAYLTGKAPTLEQFQSLYFSDRWLFTLATRLLVAGMNVVAVLLVALAGRYLSCRVGLFAAAGLALNGFFALNSVYALPDGIVPMFMALHLWLVMRVWKHRRVRDYLLAGLSLALVMLSKLSAVAVVAGLLIAHGTIVWENVGNNWRGLARSFFLSRGILLAFVGMAVGNVLFNPLAFLHPDDLIFELTRLGSYAYDSGEAGLQAYLPTVWANIVAMTSFLWRSLLPLSLMGVVAALRSRNPPHWIVLGAFAALFATIANVVSANYKIFFWMPWLIPMVLLSAIGLESLWNQAAQGKRQAVVYALAAIIVIYEGAFLLNVASKMVRPDTRQLAYEYVRQNWPADTRVMSGEPIAYSVPLRRNSASIQRAIDLGVTPLEEWRWWLSLSEDQRPAPAYDLFGPEMQAVIDTFEDMQRVLRAEYIEYVIAVDLCQGFAMLPNSESSLDFPPVSLALYETWEQVVVFSPFTTDECIAPIDDRTAITTSPYALDQQVRPGPIVRIYRVPQA